MKGSGEGGWIRVGAAIVEGEMRVDVAVQVQGELIVSIADGWLAPEAAVRYPESTLVAGFVDAHCHLAFDYGPDHETVRRTLETASVEVLHDRIERHARECLEGGVTTIRDCGDRDFTSVRFRDEVLAGRRSGPRALVSGPPLTTPDGHLNFCGGAIDPRVGDVESAVSRIASRGADFVKVMASGGGMTAESNLRSCQFSQEQLSEIVRSAHAKGLPVAAHAHSVDAIVQSVTAGVDTIEHCSWKGPDGSTDLRLDVVDAIAQEGIHVVLTMAGIQRALLPGSGANSLEMGSAVESSETGRLETDFAWARTMLEHGCRLSIASDAGVRFTSFAGFIDSVRCGIEALDVSALDAIEMATSTPAAAIGLSGECGLLAEGRVADMILLDGKILAGSHYLPDVARVWARGAQVERPASTVRKS